MQSYPLKVYPLAQVEHWVALTQAAHLAGHEKQDPLAKYFPFPQLVETTQAPPFNTDPAEQAVQ
jgi:hypothetical protein